MSSILNDLTIEIKDEELPSYVVELAKSGRAQCKKCDDKIDNKCIRVGVIIEGQWGLFTRWQHLDCTVFHKSLKSVEVIDGFRELDQTSKSLLQVRFLKSQSEVDSDEIPVDPDELVRKTWNLPKEPCENLLMPLLPYQKEGLGWMLNQELNDHHGGILADEMGMGKTIQAIALMLENRPNFKNKEQLITWLESDASHGIASTNLPKAGTLIILPTVAIRQWQTEIARFTKENSLTVKVYHGHDRNNNCISELKDTDVVITSYKILEIEYRKATAGTKVTCSICGKNFYPDKLRIHRKYFCGESAKRTEAQSLTQKRKVIVNTDHSEEDEIDKQKKMIKQLKSKVDNNNNKNEKNNKSNSKVLKATSNNDSYLEEDEIDKQKKMIKQLKSKVDNNSNLNKRNNKSNSKFMKATSNNDNYSKENEIDNQKKKKSSKSLSKDKDFINESNTLRGNMNLNKQQSLRRSSRASTLQEKSYYMSDHEDTSESSDELIPNISSSESSDSENALNSNKIQVKTSKIIIQSKDKNSKKRRRTTDNTNDSENDIEASSNDDSEVEREIRKALNDATKASIKSNSVTSKSILHMVSWFRVILDEAHLIKDRSTSTAKAVFNLVSLNKWCLSGTPLQNRVGELYSLIRFLRIDPHAYYFCKGKACNCKSLQYRFVKGKCEDCGHSVMQHYCHFNRHVLNPIKRSGYIAEGRKAMLKLKQQVLDEILLRRTKTTRADDIQLPPRIVVVRQEKLDIKEEDFYQALYTQSQAQFNTYVQSGTVLNNYAHIFDILIRLRQAVDHPYLVIYSDTQRSTKADNSNFLQGSNLVAEVCKDVKSSTICALCHEPSDEGITIDCKHCFCRSCLNEYVSTISSAISELGCPVCQKRFTIQSLDNPFCEIDLQNSNLINNNNSQYSEKETISVWESGKSNKRSILDKIDLSLFQSSTKMEALMEELYKMQEHDLGSKAIVFSQFVNMLDLLNYRIQRGGIKCIKLLGSMNLEQRDQAISAFKTDPDIKVILISLKAGGVALNLTVASRIFLMDPWWNPAAEMQAIDRTHRIGQYRPIFATRFIIEDTIEERILKLQEKKKLVFDGTVGGDSGSMAKLTVDDMRFLFN